MANFTVHLDRRFQVTGVYSAGSTYWTVPLKNSGIDTIVIGGGPSVGLIITSGISVDGAGTTFYVTGNYGGFESILGIGYTMQVDLSVPFPQSQQQNPEIGAWRQVRHVDLSYFRSAGFMVQSVMPGRATRTWSFPDPSAGTAEASGTFRARCNGKANDQTISIISSSPKRVCISSAAFEMDVNNRRD